MDENTKYGEDDLLFEEIRQFSPQWRVSLPDGSELAIVTERFISEPRYNIRIDGHDVAQHETEQEVLDTLLERANS